MKSKTQESNVKFYSIKKKTNNIINTIPNILSEFNNNCFEYLRTTSSSLIFSDKYLSEKHK